MRQLKITKSITNRESASLDKYLQEIGREELITVEEEVELAQRIRKGDQAALEKLTRANLRFVVSVAKQYQNQGLSLPDLINEGNLGLIKAAEKFDETRGFKFISYAVWWIRQSILQALAEQSRIVRLPLNQVGSLNKINKALGKFEQEYERMPTSEELAEMIDVPKEKIADSAAVSVRFAAVDGHRNRGDVQTATVPLYLAAPTALIWEDGTTAAWAEVPGAVSYNVQLLKDGVTPEDDLDLLIRRELVREVGVPVVAGQQLAADAKPQAPQRDLLVRQP